MRNFSRISACAAIFILSTLLLGCYPPGFMGQPYAPPTPEPVTPIAPPDGIRAELNNDPRHHIEIEMEQRGALPRPTLQSGELALCMGTQPAEAYSMTPEQFSASIYVQVCGWQRSNQPVDVTFSSSEGVLGREEVRTQASPYDDSGSMISAHHLVELDEDLTVTVEVRGEDGTLSAEFDTHLPTEPRLYMYETGSVWLYGFEPSETVQLLRYDVSERGYVEWEMGGGITETYTLVDYQTVTVEADGSRLFDQFGSPGFGPYGPTSHIIAIGEQTGEVNILGMMPFVEGSVFE